MAGNGSVSESARLIVSLLLTEEKPLAKPSSYSFSNGVFGGATVAGGTTRQPLAGPGTVVEVSGGELERCLVLARPWPVRSAANPPAMTRVPSRRAAATASLRPLTGEPPLLQRS